MADKAIYREKLTSIEEVPAPDELVSGTYWNADKVTVSAAGEYERGTLLMSSAEGFVKGTAEGISSAEEVCILADDITVPDDSYVKAPAYFAGTFKGERLVLWDDADLEALRPVLRRHGIFLA